MPASDGKPPAFFCPSCGQKHRANLAPLEKRPGATVGTQCGRCKIALTVRLDDGLPVCEVASQDVVTPPVKTPEAAPSTPPPPPPPPPLPEPPAHTPYDAALTDKPLKAGTMVGRYEVKGIAQKGLTSTVYRAHDPTTKRAVALKVLGVDAPQEVRERFLRQVDVQANIRHPSIPSVYDRGTLNDGRPFFAMELVHRPITLADLLARRAEGALARHRSLAPFDAIETLISRVLLPVAEGVYVANIESGVLHADLRPENVLIDGRTLRPYVVDFGRSSAQKASTDSETVTMPATHYLSPEQAAGSIHARTDVWGLGALLHSTITNQPPLSGSGRALRQSAADGQYAPLPDTSPPALIAIVRKATARVPEDRYVNARQFAADIKAWLDGGRVRALDEYGGPGATVEEKRKALRVHLLAAGWVAAGLVVGLLIGSRLQRGGNPVNVQLDMVKAATNRLGHDVTELDNRMQDAAFDRALTPTDAYGIWRSLQTRADEIERRIDQLPEAKQANAARRITFERGRIAPARILLDVPPGLLVEAVNEANGDVVTLAPGTAALPPGSWIVKFGQGGKARLRAVVPLTVRPRGTTADTVPSYARWSVPITPSKLPEGRTLVVGRTVAMSALPFAQSGARVKVPTFAIDRRMVTNARYALFLNAMPAEDRARYAPEAGMEMAADGVWRPVADAGGRPVTCIRPTDARAYCAWASKTEGVTVRLPTEAEWLLAARGSGTAWARGDLVPMGEESGYGVQELLSQPREMVTGLERTGHRVTDTLVKGPDEDDASTGLVLYEAPLLAENAPAKAVGFRCVQEVTPRPE